MMSPFKVWVEMMKNATGVASICATVDVLMSARYQRLSDFHVGRKKSLSERRAVCPLGEMRAGAQRLQV